MNSAPGNDPAASRRWRRRSLPPLAAAACALAGGCAREAEPPGGPPDRLPPIVVSSEPDTFSVVEPFRSPVVLRFSERISERPSTGTLDQAVVVSPSSGEVRVSHGREGLSVRVPGGFEAGRVYRLTVLPVIQDMFGNPLQSPYELFFSTGPEFVSNVIAGSVVDRLTGLPLRDARVDAAVAGSDVVHTAVTDSAGIFAMRYLPGGDFVVSAYLDRNRNGAPDFTEPQGTRPAPLNGSREAADTVIVLDVALLASDTTAARIARVIVEDSVSLNVSFDDHLDTGLPLDGVRVRIFSDSVDAPPEPLAVLHEHEAAAVRAALADSAARAREAAAAQDSAVAEGDLANDPDSARRESADPASGPGPEAERPPAAQGFVVVLDEALVPEMPYEIEVSNVVNVNGVGGGGGTVGFTRPAPPPSEDTVQAVADSAAADTVSVGATQATDTVGRDTASSASASPDTLTAPADSIRRDTLPPPPPDTARRDTIPAVPGDSLGRDTASASTGALVRRDADRARSGVGALPPQARRRFARRSPSRTDR